MHYSLHLIMCVCVCVCVCVCICVCKCNLDPQPRHLTTTRNSLNVDFIIVIELGVIAIVQNIQGYFTSSLEFLYLVPL